MSKNSFIVRHTRPGLFHAGKAKFEMAFSRIEDAWYYALELRESNNKDGRWPVLSVEIVYQ